MEQVHPVLLLILSIGIFGGILGGQLFQKCKIPQVVGYIAIGLLVGQTGFGFITQEHITQLRSFNFFALGVIGFLVGGELQLDTFRKYGRQFTAILLGEGIASFVLVATAATLIIYLVYPHFYLALAGGLVLGAIASATDPASTIDVLWEYRSKGVLTTGIIAIVALDDALAMALYGLGTSASQMLATGSSDLVGIMLRISLELGGAIVLGALAAVLLAKLLRLLPKPERRMALTVGLLMLIISISLYWEMDVILAAMTMGCVLTNLVPHRSKKVFSLLRSFSIPIYVIFFVLVGARLQLTAMPWWIWLLVITYVIGRSVGKVVGARVGAKVSKAPVVLQNYLGTSLFAQGGVAIGLSIMAGQSLSTIMITETLDLGNLIISVVTTTTLLVQIIGPAMVAFSIKRAGEAGRDLTEEDVLKAGKVGEYAITDFTTVSQDTPLSVANKLFCSNEQFLFPVLDKENTLVGVLTLSAIRDVVSSPADWQWLLAADVMLEASTVSHPQDNLHEAFQILTDQGLDQIPVIDDNRNIIGLLDRRVVRHRVQEAIMGDTASPKQTPQPTQST